MSEQSVLSCKVVLLGESGVGKTSIISRYLHNSFNDHYQSTNGANYAAKSMIFNEYDCKSVKFEIWDTAGQERFRSLNKIFYKDASIAILVYDITRLESFEEIKKYWYKALQENSLKKIVIGIAGNKCDLYEKEQVDEANARAFAEEIGAVLKMTSAMNANGIEELFKALGKRVLDPDSVNRKEGDDDKDTNDDEQARDERGQSIKINKGDKKKEKKKCC